MTTEELIWSNPIFRYLTMRLIDLDRRSKMRSAYRAKTKHRRRNR